MGIPVWISRDLEVPEFPEQSSSAQFADLAQAESANDPGKALTSSQRSTGSQISSLAADLQSEESSHSVRPAQNGEAAKSVSPKSAGPGLHAADDLIHDLQQNPSAKIAEIAASLDEGPVAAPVSLVPVSDLKALGWADLQQKVDACTACDLYTQRQQTVFGKGNTQAQWMIVGDIPRLEDEWQQQPFTGESGELLNAMLASIGLDSNLVYMTNLMKCRPPLDRSPEPEQATSCYSYLQRQIELLNPALVILMGRDVVTQVLGASQSMSGLRLQAHQREGIAAPIIATYHPSYLLKQPRLKAKVWQDLVFAKKQVMT